MPEKIKILVIDDHQLFIDGIKLLLASSELEVNFHSALDANQAFQLIQQMAFFDLILLDMNLPGINGLSFIKKLKDSKSWSPVLVVSADESFQVVNDALNYGALGFVSKTGNSETLMQAIKTVLAGDIYLSPTWKHLVNQTHEQPVAEQLNITPRQLETLHLAAQGLANKVICAELGISENTVKAHMHALFKALSVTNRTACIQKAKDLGIINP